MGALTDITAYASNTMKRQSNSSTGYQSLDSPTSAKKTADKENAGQAKSPHFMTPTFSSSLQSVATNNIAPLSSTKPSEAKSNSAWMRSAAKRVGFRRVGGDGLPRSKKEEPPKSSRTISFPDKLATPSYPRVLDTHPSRKTQSEKASPRDKPLPNPPSGQPFVLNDLIESKTLIDASEKPLRRPSPPGMPLHEEDWPVLFPKRPTIPGTLQEMLRDTGSQLTQQVLSEQKERYPLLGNTLRQVPDEDHLPVSRYSATYKVPSKEASSPNLGKPVDTTEDTIPRIIHTEDPFKDGVYNSGPLLPAKFPRPTSESPSELSAGAAAIEKLAQESRSTIEPRQTRTSSLRARLSAGQLVKDSQNKVVGFTHFTAIPEPAIGTAQRDSLRARKEAQTEAQRSLTPSAKPVSHPLRTNPSRESIGGNRAPAQFVAGSRRPTHPRRPSSRGSLRVETREPTPSLAIPSSSRPPPSRPTPTIPRSENTKHGKPLEKAPAKVLESKSSIPVPRQAMSNMPNQPTGKAEIMGSTEAEVNGVKEARDEFAIFEGPSLSDKVKMLDQALSKSSWDAMRGTNPSYSNGRPTQALVDSNGAHLLEAIEESPQRSYKFRRFSTASPEFGPTLKISTSAERIIMGPDTKIEKNPLSKKKSKELDVPTMKKDLKDRPSSSQGLSRRDSRVNLVNSKAREKRVKSADLGNLSSAIDHLAKDSQKLIPRLNQESTDTSARGSSSRTSFNDPFFDAHSQLQASPEKSNVIDDQEPNAPAEESWNSVPGLEADASRDNVAATLGNSASPSHIDNGVQSNYHSSGKENNPFESDAISVRNLVNEPKDGPPSINLHMRNESHSDNKLSDEASAFEDSANAPKDSIERSDIKEDDTSTTFLPSTPEQRPTRDTSSSRSHPPRSSSRMPRPDFTTAGSSPVSLLSVDKGPVTPLKDADQDFARRQNNLGSVRGHGTSQVDLSDQSHKRDSTARESSKSQVSLSKGSLSIFRGLFPKRSSENEPLKSGKKAKSKPAINGSTGSPFPPISEVHPIHRPTLASLARSAANTPRPCTAPGRPITPATPSLASPLGTTETSATSTQLAMELLDLSRKERSSPKKERLLQLGSIMVEGITQARNAEKAMEEAKQAARRAEVAHALCKKSLKEVTKCVEVWKGGL